MNREEQEEEAREARQRRMVSKGVWLVNRIPFNGRCMVLTVDGHILLLDPAEYEALPHLDSPPIVAKG